MTIARYQITKFRQKLQLKGAPIVAIAKDNEVFVDAFHDPTAPDRTYIIHTVSEGVTFSPEIMQMHYLGRVEPYDGSAGYLLFCELEDDEDSDEPHADSVDYKMYTTHPAYQNNN